MSNHKKLYLFLTGLITCGGIFLWYQIHKAGNINISQDTNPIVAPYPTDIVLSNAEPSLGTPGADIQIIEFNDVSCKDCLAVHTEIQNFIRNHPENNLQLVWKDAVKPSFFTPSDIPHAAAICANTQHKFWDFLNHAIEKNKKVPEDPSTLQTLASEVGINTDIWNNCLMSETTKEKILSDKILGNTLKLSELPALFINNKQIFLTPEINVTELLSSLTTQ